MSVLIYLTKRAAAQINRPHNGWYVADSGLTADEARNAARAWRAKGYRTKVHPTELVAIEQEAR